ncbi:MAG: hypothetical protein GX882_02170 [Methanomicrobiales archaeon]|nr:hypothetical protein [Methanomicrobiales archaeon]
MSRYTGFLILILAVLAGSAGCLSTTFQEVTYGGDGLEIYVENADEPFESAVLQVTIMKVEALTQSEVFRKAQYVNLDSGRNVYTFPVDLEPGSYKLFLLVLTGNERRASVIRELEVTP